MRTLVKTTFFAFTLLWLPPAAAQEVENTSFVAEDGTRVLEHRITLEATGGPGLAGVDHHRGHHELGRAGGARRFPARRDLGIELQP